MGYFAKSLKLSLNRALKPSSLIKRMIHPCRLYSACCSRNEYDLVVVGGGIIGTACAREIKERFPHIKMTLIEKEHKLAAHQSGNNSGIIHSGIYCNPGSLKANLCMDGSKLLYDYCDRKNIPFKSCGKLIVATNAKECTQLNNLFECGKSNGINDLIIVQQDQIKNIEPYCCGKKAIWSPNTGNVDYACVTKQLARDYVEIGGTIIHHFEVKSMCENFDPNSLCYPITITGCKDNQIIHTKHVLTACGLQADLVARMSGCSCCPYIIPFRCEYQLLAKKKCKMVYGNIFPAPDACVPFLGPHIAQRMDGSVVLGPNSVIALAREGYGWKNCRRSEFMEMFRFKGFKKFTYKYPGFAFKQVAKSLYPPLQLSGVKKFIPNIQITDVCKGPCGVRAQAVDADGDIIDDFMLERADCDGVLGKNILHIRVVPSVGATSSLAIAKIVACKVQQEFEYEAKGDADKTTKPPKPPKPDEPCNKVSEDPSECDIIN